MQQPLLAQALSRVVTRYGSEWGGDDSKWVALDPLVLDGIPEWQAEKLRIKRLRWWPKVAGEVQGFPASPLAYHIHPIGLIANFHGEPGAAAAAPTARRTANRPLEKSGKQWVRRFPSSKAIADLRRPFQGNVAKLFAALAAGGVTCNINTTLRARSLRERRVRSCPKVVPDSPRDPAGWPLRRGSQRRANSAGRRRPLLRAAVPWAPMSYLAARWICMLQFGILAPL